MEKPGTHFLDAERKIIHLMLKSRDSIEEVLDDGISPEYFDAQHKVLVESIFAEYIKSEKKRLLTRPTYRQMLIDAKVGGDVMENLTIYDRCFIQAYASSDDLTYLKKLLVEGFISRECYFMFEGFKKRSKTDGYLGAAHALHDKLKNVLGITDTGRTTVVSLSEMKDEFVKDLEYRKNNTDKVVRTGIYPEIDDAINVGFRPQHLTLFVADVGGHKCVRHDAKINLENGSFITAEDLYTQFNAGSSGKLLSLNDDFKVYPQKAISVMPNGVKECFKVITRLGHALEITDNHPLLTLEGYVKLSDISVGDHVAISRKMPFGKKKVSLEEAVWLGCMYSDGGTTQSTYTFSNIDQKIIDAMSLSTEKLGGKFRQKKYQGKAVEGNFLVNGMQELGRYYGLHGKSAKNKNVHPEVYTWNRESLRQFLTSMFGCDGCITVSKDRVGIIYASSSHDLAKDVRNLLMKFGIIATLSQIKVKYKGEHRPSWQVKIRDSEQILKFITEVGFLGCKSEISKSCVSFLRSKKTNRNIDLIPSSIWNKLDEKFKEYGKSHYGCRRLLKAGENKRGNEGHCGTRRKSINRSVLKKISKFLNDDNELLSIAESDVVWDEIVSIESVGKHQTYDISMMYDPNFIVDNFITHNTNMMLNISLALYDRGHSVLFIPLEMSRVDLMGRVIANRAKINFNKLACPEMLNEEEWSRIKECQIWEEHQHRFCILDADERTSVGRLQQEIEKRSLAFKPDVVIIDYIANLKPDRRFGDRNDLEIGEILKSLRFMGKKYGFHVISAAQMGRQALKSLKDDATGVPDSTSIRGSHEYSADSDTIFGLMKVKDEPDKIKLAVIKARHGPSGGPTKNLHVQPEYCMISSMQNMNSITSSSVEDVFDLEGDLNEPVDKIAATQHPKITFANTNFDDIDDIGDLGG